MNTSNDLKIPLHDFKTYFPHRFAWFPFLRLCSLCSPKPKKKKSRREEKTVIISFRIELVNSVNQNKSTQRKNVDGVCRNAWRMEVLRLQSRNHENKEQREKESKSEIARTQYLCVTTNHSCNCWKSQIAYDTSHQQAPKCPKTHAKEMRRRRRKKRPRGIEIKMYIFTCMFVCDVFSMLSPFVCWIIIRRESKITSITMAII